jgi:hypothetical protein
MNGTIIEIFDDDTTTSIQLVTDTGDTTNIQVANIKLYLDEVDDLVYIYDNSQSLYSKGASAYEPCYYTLDFNQITTPVEPDAANLYMAVLAMMVAATGGGDATAANQVIGNNLLKDTAGGSAFRSTEGGLSVFKDAIGTSHLAYISSYVSSTNSYTISQWGRFTCNVQTQEIFNAATLAQLKIDIQTFKSANPGKALMFQSIFVDGLGYSAFCTFANS